jgi:hypothetical protein
MNFSTRSNKEEEDEGLLLLFRPMWTAMMPWCLGELGLINGIEQCNCNNSAMR